MLVATRREAHDPHSLSGPMNGSSSLYFGQGVLYDGKGWDARTFSTFLVTQAI
jgi:hypothetical protein